MRFELSRADCWQGALTLSLAVVRLCVIRANPMPKPPYVLSFATDQERDQLFIHADAAGLDYLIRSLARIRQSIDANICDHDHLMTAAWGGSELTERGLDEGTRTVQHVKIYGWTP